MPMRRQALRSIEPLATSLFFSLILIFSLALPSLLVKAEPVTSDAAGRVTPGEMNTGALLLPTDDGGFVEAPRLGTDVIMTVNGTIARVTVTQRFENTSDRWLEGIYVFPLPEQSAVDALRMEIGVARDRGRDQGPRRRQEGLRGGQGRRPEGEPGRAGAAEHLHQLGRQYRPARGDRRPHRISGDGEAGRRRLFAALPARRRAPL